MKLIMLLLLLVFQSPAHATEAAQPPFRGEGVYSWLFIKIYRAKLWSFKEADIYSKPVKLELQYLKSFKGKDIVKQSLKELTSAGVTSAELTEFQTKLTEIFPDVGVGDVILADYRPTAGITFYFNSDKELGKLADSNLARKFLDIWLGEKTTAPQLRNILLGNYK